VKRHALEFFRVLVLRLPAGKSGHIAYFDYSIRDIPTLRTRFQAFNSASSAAVRVMHTIFFARSGGSIGVESLVSAESALCHLENKDKQEA